jgi:hypothetical protein
VFWLLLSYTDVPPLLSLLLPADGLDHQQFIALAVITSNCGQKAIVLMSRVQFTRAHVVLARASRFA